MPVSVRHFGILQTVSYRLISHKKFSCLLHLLVYFHSLIVSMSHEDNISLQLKKYLLKISTKFCIMSKFLGRVFIIQFIYWCILKISRQSQWRDLHHSDSIAKQASELFLNFYLHSYLTFVNTTAANTSRKPNLWPIHTGGHRPGYFDRFRLKAFILPVQKSKSASTYGSFTLNSLAITYIA